VGNPCLSRHIMKELKKGYMDTEQHGIEKRNRKRQKKTLGPGDCINHQGIVGEPSKRSLIYL